MENSRARLADAALYRRGESITAWARALSVGFALVAKLVDNALEYGPPEGRVVVRGFCEPEETVFSVRLPRGVPGPPSPEARA